MSRRVPFARWIEDLEYEVIQGKFGYEDGEFTVYPHHWRAQWKRGDTPLQAFQSALDAHAEARRLKIAITSIMRPADEPAVTNGQ